MSQTPPFAQWIDLGTFSGFQKRVNALSQLSDDHDYRFTRASGNFWLLEVEDNEEILGGLLHVRKGRVYAISEDVYVFVNQALKR